MNRGKTTSSRLRHRLTLQEEIRTPDGAGGYTRSWQDIAQLWAEITPLGNANSKSTGLGRETLFGGALQAENHHRITLRYRAGVTAGMRLVFEDRIFNIRSVMNIEERNDLLELLVQEGVGV